MGLIIFRILGGTGILLDGCLNINAREKPKAPELLERKRITWNRDGGRESGWNRRITEEDCGW
jgi:hypothetical protein